MKKTIAFLLTLAMSFALLCSCAKKEQQQTPPPALDTQDQTEQSDEKIQFVDLFYNADGVNGHPNAASHVQYAKIYEDKIREDFGITDKL